MSGGPHSHCIEKRCRAQVPPGNVRTGIAPPLRPGEPHECHHTPHDKCTTMGRALLLSQGTHMSSGEVDALFRGQGALSGSQVDLRWESSTRPVHTWHALSAMVVQVVCPSVRCTVLGGLPGLALGGQRKAPWELLCQESWQHKSYPDHPCRTCKKRSCMSRRPGGQGHMP